MHYVFLTPSYCFLPSIQLQKIMPFLYITCIFRILLVNLSVIRLYLVSSKGTMLVEMNRTSSLPVVLEMAEGCLESDARLLLRRLACSNAVPTDEHARVIDVSP